TGHGSRRAAARERASARRAFRRMLQRRPPMPSRAASAAQPAAPAPIGPLLRLPDDTVLQQVFALKYGPDAELGWGPRLRAAHGYHTPDDWYEALLASVVVPGIRWLDVGCGRELCPNNRALASVLAARAGRLVGLDPDPTLQENPFVHEKVGAGI